MLEGCPRTGLKMARYLEKMSLCPVGGIGSSMGEQLPVFGALNMKCSLADEGPAPASATGR